MLIDNMGAQVRAGGVELEQKLQEALQVRCSEPAPTT